jgi:hypothetical protein
MDPNHPTNDQKSPYIPERQPWHVALEEWREHGRGREASEDAVEFIRTIPLAGYSPGRQDFDALVMAFEGGRNGRIDRTHGTHDRGRFDANRAEEAATILPAVPPGIPPAGAPAQGTPGVYQNPPNEPTGVRAGGPTDEEIRNAEANNKKEDEARKAYEASKTRQSTLADVLPSPEHKASIATNTPASTSNGTAADTRSSTTDTRSSAHPSHQPNQHHHGSARSRT